tara:strand:+ start:4052 stop:5299 length:1248 start_codon:yes stop_codon:yes gene_type:complete
MILDKHSLEKVIGISSEFEVYDLVGGLVLHGGKGGGSAPAPPAAPDPVATANAQGAANKAAAISQGELAMVNQATPYGSIEYTPRGVSEGYEDVDGKQVAGTPQYTATTTLDPSSQRQLDFTNRAGEQYGQIANTQLDEIAGKLSQPVDFASLGQAPVADLSTLGNAATANFNSLGAAPTANYDSLGNAPVANEQTRQAVRQSIQDREKPFQDRRLQELQSRLDTQGIAQGSKAYSDAMFDNNRSINDFNLGADGQALGQMSQLYGLEADQRNRATNEIGQLYGLQAEQRGRATNEIGQQFDFANQARDRSLRDIESQYGLDANARDRGVNELTQQRQIPLNELAAMLSGSQVQGPQFVSTPAPSIAAGDIQGATYANYQGAQNAYNQQQASNASAKGGMGNTIGSLAMAGATAY